MKALSVRETKFLDLYLQGVKVADAYRQAGYVSKDRGTARAHGCRLLKRPHVSAALAARQAANKAIQHLTEEEAIGFLTRVVRTPAGKVSVDDDVAQEYVETTGEIASTLRVRMPDKIKAIQHLTLLLGWGKDQKRQQEQTDTLKEFLLSIRAGTA
jgi:phage terminase small subunit